MESLNLNDFFRYIFFKTTLRRIYSRQVSKREIIKQLSDKFSMTDDLYLTKPNPKRFVGSFLPNSDDFIANMTQSLWRFTSTVPRLIEVHGSILEKENIVQIEVEYKQTNEVKKQLWILSIVNVCLILLMILKVRDTFTILALLFFMAVMTGAILVTSYNTIQRQIRYTEKFLVYDLQKTAGNTR